MSPVRYLTILLMGFNSHLIFWKIPSSHYLQQTEPFKRIEQQAISWIGHDRYRIRQTMSQHNILFSAIKKLLKPLVRILLRNGILYGALLDIIKPIYIEVASEHIAKTGKKLTKSRISTITGIPRKEVQRLLDLGDVDDVWAFERYNRAARVVSGWVRDPRFSDKQQQPQILSYDGKSPSFIELVAAFSGDIPARTILDELLEAEVVRELQNGKLQLIKRAYIPTPVESEKLGILGRDVAGLLNTLGHNIYQKEEQPYFQRKVFYDNLPEEYIPKLKEFIEEHAQSLMEKMDHEMSANDRDTNPSISGTGRCAAGLGIYYFEENIQQE